MKALSAVPFIKELLSDAVTAGAPPEAIFKPFERDFLEGICRIGASGKMLDLTEAQEKLLCSIYYAHVLLPKIKTKGYDAKKRTPKEEEER